MSKAPVHFSSRAAVAVLIVAATLTSSVPVAAAELRVTTDFEGGSARIEKVDQVTRTIRFMPGGDPQHGWPCWWYLRVEGAATNEVVTFDLAGSLLPARNNGKNTGKPLAAEWAMPERASFSTDGKIWRQTDRGLREGNRIRYQLPADSGPLWVAWGPPFTPRDTDELISWAEKALPAAKGFELSRTRGDRPVRGLRVSEATISAPPGIWVHARQHSWESGSSWVARGLVEWLVSDDVDARWLRSHSEVFIVPIMDVDNVATGNGGKEAAPRDHNRDWDAQPVHPEVAAAQKRLQDLASAGRLDLFLDLHNPGPSDARPFFFVGTPELLTEVSRLLRTTFLDMARVRIKGPLVLDEKAHITGPNYHPLWRQISGQWVNDHGNPHTVAACLETAWNTPHSTTDGYRTVGRQLGQTVTDFMRSKMP